jgi:hypothetical protein
MNQEKYITDIQEIKEMMAKSSRFISLSGLSGIFAGTFALIGVYFAYRVVYIDQDYFALRKALITKESLILLLFIAAVTLFLSLGSGVLFTSIKAKRLGQKLWDGQTKRLLLNLMIPLLTGGILCMLLLIKGYVGIVAPLTLIFYGLALVNASKYTLSGVRSLGILEILLGLIAVQYIGYGLVFWAIGFGVLHIIYGIVMHFKYES